MRMQEHDKLKSVNVLPHTIIFIALTILSVLTINAYTTGSSNYNNTLDITSAGDNISSQSYNNIVTTSSISDVINSTSYDNYIGFAYAMLTSGDNSSPTFQFNSTNASEMRIYDFVRFNVTCNDSGGLHGFLFSHNNSRIWKNESYVYLSGTQAEANFTLQINLTRRDTLGWFFICNDTSRNLGFMSELTFGINNTAPQTVNLSFPLANVSMTNRTPAFNWSAYDADNDTLSFNLTITRVSCGDISNDCFTDLLKFSLINATNFTTPTELDIDAIYNWSVVTFDGLNYSQWAEIRNFTVVSLLSMKLTVSSANFGNLNINDVVNTTENSPQPITIENDGNVRLNLTIYANQSLWVRNYAGLDTRYFQMKPGNTSELGAYNYSASPADWVNVSSSQLNIFKSLHYNDSKDTAEIDLLIRVPPDEDPGSKVTGLVIQGAQTTP